MRRREFLQSTVTLAAASLIAPRAWAAADRPRILLRSSWQVVNIGDIAHTPGVLALIEKHFPEAEVRLWASGDLTDEVAAMEHRRFAQLKIVKGGIQDNGRASTPELEDAVRWADFLLHGSGPSLVAAKDVAAWDKHLQKPFGIFGITYGGGTPEQIALMSRAKFAFFRDSVSLQKAKDDGIKSPVMEFGPDGAFACDLRNVDAAAEFLRANQLVDGKFLCCIPRLRYTPYWLIKKREVDPQKVARNAEMAEHEHAPLR
ncbi:MAG TPA: polysaccharide pyruvyl transferase family protein, partial [Planctomycetaceae bacterium]|nr:polysaccharide pyruvyl transferase family protein [Planctomycetaceae bacterium]